MGVLKKFCKIHGKTTVPNSLIFNKVVGWRPAPVFLSEFYEMFYRTAPGVYFYKTYPLLITSNSKPCSKLN